MVCRLIPFKLSEGATDTLVFIIRKMAHFTEYAILGILYLGTAYYFVRYREIKDSKEIKEGRYKADNKKKIRLVLLASVICMLYAISDEFHQSFTDGRSPAVRDVIIDTCGGFAGSILAFFCMQAAGKRKERKETK